jgi:hypothetical protein
MFTKIRLPTNETQFKVIRFRDRDLTIYGRGSDPYFQNFTFEDGTNDFLLKITEEFVGNDSVIFDIGANIGTTRVW